MNYSELIDHLLKENIGYEHFNPGLGNIKKAIKLWNLDEINAKVITVAGTNGKGETTRAIGHLLKDYSFIQWTSPHVSCISERFVINARPIDCKDLYKLVNLYLEKYKLLDFSLSYYEFLFIIFLELNKRLNPDFVLLEVGLGGRVDAVNVLDCDVAVLTSISRDHQEFLGNRLDEIILEKLAVTRTNKLLVSSLETKYLRQIVQKYCSEKQVQWYDLIESDIQLKSFNYSQRNKLLATKVYEFICNCTVSQQEWNGYQSSTMTQWVVGGVTFYGLGSHNPDGLRKLVQFLSQQNYNNFDALIFSFSKRNIQDIECMFKIIEKMKVSSKKLVSFNHPKAMDTDALKKLACAYERVEFVEDSEKLISEIPPNSKVVVCGSYYFLGQFRKQCQSTTQQ